MRSVPPGLATHLAGAATTLCRCWRLVRRDGLAFGFTDHDRDLAFAGTTFVARSGLEAAEATAELGFAVGGGEAAGAFTADGITEADILAGFWDDATVECWLVNWVAPGERLLLDRASIGEIRRAEGTFVAELRAPTHRFDEERGHLYRRTCSADLGDARCRVDLAQPVHRLEAAVLATDGDLRFEAAGPDHPDETFSAGRLVWLGGTNAGQSVEVRAHRRAGTTATFDLWQRPAWPIAVGDAFGVTAGCDKRFATCAGRFGNVVNFRGFPHLPGNDFVLRVPLAGEPGLDGGSLFR